MRKFLSIVLIAATLFTMVSAGIMTSSASSDPADTYKAVAAPYEDSSIQMWFEHSTVKVHQEDTASTGRDTYSVYMAKNEIQGTQIVLYSPNEKKSNLTADISSFTSMDGSGATIDAELFFEFYIEATNLNVTDVLGVTDPSESIIREGVIPDAIAPISIINKKTTGSGTFSLGAGKTQTLLARLKTTLDTAPGWYSATFNLYNSSKQVIKTATVFAYVWDFAIPEEMNYQTAVHIDKGTMSDALYKEWYDYLLENRILGMVVPGEINSSNEYISNPRVSAFRISDHPYHSEYSADKIKSIYDDLSTMENWDKIKEKAYFYNEDEPTSKEQADAIFAANGKVMSTVDKVISQYKRLSSSWENPNVVLPFHENHPYPYYKYDTMLAFKDGKYLTATDGSDTFADVKDSIQAMMDTESVTVWCPKMNAYTPQKYLTNYVGTNEAVTKVRNLDGIVSGFNIHDPAGCFFSWDSIYGSFQNRIDTFRAEKAEEGKNMKLWWYACGNNSHYTYCNHLIENTGLQTELMFWQSMQVGATGYLYYGSNLYAEIDGKAYVRGSSNAYDGSLIDGKWRVNKTPKGAYSIYGNGVLFYGSDIRSVLRLGASKYVGTLRVEQMRDGIEDYEMLNLYREYYGEEKMQQFINKVSDNVACYLSLPGFDRSSWSNDLTSEDIFALVRIELGNAVEAAAKGGTTSGYTVTVDGKVYGKFEAGATVTLPVPENTEINGYEARFFTWTGADVARSEYGADTANGRTYTMTIPESDVELTSSYVVIGDADCDGRITAIDSIVMKLAMSGNLTNITDKQLEAMDTEFDGVSASLADSLVLKKIITFGKIPSEN